MRLLLVEDDELIAESLVKALAQQNYVLDIAVDGQAGWELASACTYDLILLDVRLPKLNGIDLCRRLRSQGFKTPVLLLTAQDTSTNRVLGLDAGADDYVAKPFDLAELLARIRALLRRGTTSLPPQLVWGNLCLDPSTCEVTYQDQALPLSPKEYSLLELFLRSPQRVFSCGVILDHLWSFEEAPGEDTVRAHIKGLRHKLKATGALQEGIETVYGLGYRLKPLSSKPAQAAPSLTGDGQAQPTQQTLKAIAGVWDRSQAKLQQRLTVIEQAVAALQQGQLREELRQQALQAAHKLSGSLGMFGLAEGSRLAQSLEQLLSEAQVGLTSGCSQLVSALRQQLDADRPSPPGWLSLVEPGSLLIMSQAQSWVAALIQEATNQGLATALLPDPAAVREWLSGHAAQALLLDLSCPDLDAALQLLAELHSQRPSLPTFVLTAPETEIDRVEVARLGGRGFFQQPIAGRDILEAVTHVLQRSQPVEARILAVDDDPEVLIALRSLLEPWGLRLVTLEEPLRFWQTLEAAVPDLLILDVAMPTVDGVELCRVVRNDPRWSGLPVLFLTARTDPETCQRVFAAGADDYIRKPIVGPELLTRILNRLERSRLLRRQAEVDPLTRLANRPQAARELTRLLQLAERHRQPLCLALFDLKHLRQINDQYGFATGDRVLVEFANLLQQTFQSEDVIARWGSDKFVVGMYGLGRSDGMRRLASLWKALPSTAIPEASLAVNWTVGLAQASQDGADLQSLYQAAYNRLQQAKAADISIPMVSCA